MKRKILIFLIVMIVLIQTTAYSATKAFFGDNLIGIPFPNIKNVVLKVPTKDYYENNYHYQFYDNFSEDDYLQLSRFYYGINTFKIHMLRAEGHNNIQLISLSDHDIVTYVTPLNYPETGVRFCWDWADNTFECIYDPGTYLVDEIPVNLLLGEITSEDLGEFLIFPNAAFGRVTVMPSIDVALKCEYDAKVIEDNQTKYVYLSFTDEDYEKVGEYLGNAGCSLTGYTVDGNVIVLTMEKNQNVFRIRYDRDAFTAEAFYNPDLVPEKYEPPAVSAKTEGTGIYLSEAQCYDVAMDYINSTLRNPKSLQIHSCNKEVMEEKVRYVFDYSAMNGFGGYTRSNYYITVNRYTGEITFAFST